MKCVQNDSVQRKPPFPCAKGTVLSVASHGQPVAWETGMESPMEFLSVLENVLDPSCFECVQVIGQT